MSEWTKLSDEYPDDESRGAEEVDCVIKLFNGLVQKATWYGYFENEHGEIVEDEKVRYWRRRIV